MLGGGIRGFRQATLVRGRAATVSLTYETHASPDGNGALDTPAIWVTADANRSLLFVTDNTKPRRAMFTPSRLWRH